MFSKGLTMFALDLSRKTEILLVIKAESEDVIEVGLKDVNYNETKVKFIVKQGWHGYVIPIEDFRGVNTKQIEMFLISHSYAIKLLDSNRFWIAHVDFR